MQLAKFNLENSRYTLIDGIDNHFDGEIAFIENCIIGNSYIVVWNDIELEMYSLLLFLFYNTRYKHFSTALNVYNRFNKNGFTLLDPNSIVKWRLDEAISDM
jgi:hypothetical protein